MSKLMVLESAWHYRKATYWDMPKCATCDHRKPHDVCGVHHFIARHDFGCVHHSEIEQPTKDKEG